MNMQFDQNKTQKTNIDFPVATNSKLHNFLDLRIKPNFLKILRDKYIKIKFNINTE